MNYRAEIDGLRALAVIAVILFHANIEINNFHILKGGFLGVDIFFTISGYLITSIILKELRTTNSFSFINFYQRRINRILPALFVVLIISFPISWTILRPEEFINLSNSALHSLFFIVNYFFISLNTQYNAPGSIFIPLLHLWSLSIEEQFYIIFPITFILIFKYLRKYIFFFFILLLLFSFIYNYFLEIYERSENYFYLFSKAWELIAGILIAYFEKQIY